MEIVLAAIDVLLYALELARHKYLHNYIHQVCKQADIRPHIHLRTKQRIISSWLYDKNSFAAEESLVLYPRIWLEPGNM